MITGISAVTAIRIKDGRKLTMMSGIWNLSSPRIRLRISLAWEARISGAVKNMQITDSRTLPRKDQKVIHVLFFWGRHNVDIIFWKEWSIYLQVLPVYIPRWRGEWYVPSIRFNEVTGGGFSRFLRFNIIVDVLKVKNKNIYANF